MNTILYSFFEYKIYHQLYHQQSQTPTPNKNQTTCIFTKMNTNSYSKTKPPPPSDLTTTTSRSTCLRVVFVCCGVWSSGPGLLSLGETRCCAAPMLLLPACVRKAHHRGVACTCRVSRAGCEAPVRLRVAGGKKGHHRENSNSCFHSVAVIPFFLLWLGEVGAVSSTWWTPCACAVLLGGWCGLCVLWLFGG